MRKLYHLLHRVLVRQTIYVKHVHSGGWYKVNDIDVLASIVLLL